MKGGEADRLFSFAGLLWEKAGWLFIFAGLLGANADPILGCYGLLLRRSNPLQPLAGRAGTGLAKSFFQAAAKVND